MPDNPQIVVRLEQVTRGKLSAPAWAYYVAGERKGYELSEGEAKAAALRWAKLASAETQ